MVSSEDEDLCNVAASESEDEGPFGFKRNKSCQYHMVSRIGKQVGILMSIGHRS